METFRFHCLFCLNAKRGPFPRIGYDFISYPFRGNGPLFCVWPFRTRSKYQKSPRLAFNHHALCLTTVVPMADFATIFIPFLHPYPELRDKIRFSAQIHFIPETYPGIPLKISLSPKIGNMLKMLATKPLFIRELALNRSDHHSPNLTPTCSVVPLSPRLR